MWVHRRGDGPRVTVTEGGLGQFESGNPQFRCSCGEDTAQVSDGGAAKLYLSVREEAEIVWLTSAELSKECCA